MIEIHIGSDPKLKIDECKLSEAFNNISALIKDNPECYFFTLIFRNGSIETDCRYGEEFEEFLEKAPTQIYIAGENPDLDGACVSNIKDFNTMVNTFEHIRDYLNVDNYMFFNLKLESHSYVFGIVNNEKQRLSTN